VGVEREKEGENVFIKFLHVGSKIERKKERKKENFHHLKRMC